MRNHLAEDMLDDGMRNLMECYKQSLRDGRHLTGAVSLLDKTSALISIFRDKRPFVSVYDTRMSQLTDILSWLTQWEDDVAKRNDSSDLEKGKMLFSWQCREDLKALLMGFQEVVRMHLTDFPGSAIYAHRFNSDIVENHFSQIRGVCNGNLTHPNYFTYCHTVGSVILSQSVTSKGRKSNAGIPAASYYDHNLEPPTKKKQMLRI